MQQITPSRRPRLLSKLVSSIHISNWITTMMMILIVFGCCYVILHKWITLELNEYHHIEINQYDTMIQPDMTTMIHSLYDSIHTSTNTTNISSSSNTKCILQFRDGSTMLCMTNTSNTTTIITNRFYTILQQYFPNCSSQYLRTMDLSHHGPQRRFQRKCFFLEMLPDYHSWIQEGDVYWGFPLTTNNNSHPLLNPHLQTFWMTPPPNNHNTTDVSHAMESFLPVSKFFHPIVYENTTVIILLGELRGGEHTWDTLYRHVLDVNQADLILVPIGKIPKDKNTSSLLSRAKVVLPIPHYHDWSIVMDSMVDTGIDTNKNYRKVLTKLLGKKSILLGGSSLGKNKYGSGALLFAARWILRQYIHDNHFSSLYQRFVLTRSDQYYLCDHNLSTLLPISDIYIPQGEDYGGICDRHLVCSSQDVARVLNVLPPLVRYPEQYFRYNRSLLANTESFLNIRLQEMNLSHKVQRFPRTMFLAGVDGDNYTLKAPVKKHLSEGVYYKYEREYVRAKNECFAILRHELQMYGNHTHLSYGDVMSQFRNRPMGFATWDGTVVTGWACDHDNPIESITIRIVLQTETIPANEWSNTVRNDSTIRQLSLPPMDIHHHHFPNDTIYERFVVADMKSGAFVQKKCNGGIQHRFHALIPNNVTNINSSIAIHVYALDPMDPTMQVKILKKTIH